MNMDYKNRIHSRFKFKM
ncbi:hypothetical protein BLA29_011562 [Euroglyphus maynei]|uniref:Uncharacterized protein n=1 Tax=Euroglyphus maynei TaxID=6958 RepID=A0A1Y3AQK3_EURMA|nr:hypothetical protein BLA29_011562 [Euroglyphus maynei]